MSIPKKIWLYWGQGWENVPPVVKKCADSWVHYNPDWEINFLTEETLKKYIDIGNIKISTFAALSDIIRINLLKKYGGIWCDATVWCNKPLNEWITHYTDFFAFSKPAPDRLIASWFLASSPNNYIITNWHEKVTMYWRYRTVPHNYFWFHYLFNELFQNDKQFREKWESTTPIECPINSSDGPHHFAPYTTKQLTGVTDKFKKMIDNKISPVFKLGHHWPLEKYDKIKYLFNSIS